jgi:hypothetical protein
MIVMWVLMLSSAKGQGVHTGLRSGLAVLGGKGKTLWGELAYPAAMRSTDAALGFSAEKRFMTDLNLFELGLRTGIGKQPVQFHIYRAGIVVYSDLGTSVSMVKNIGPGFSIAARIGYAFTQATGYAGRGHPLAGLGALFSFGDKCRWAVQADGINSFFNTREGDDYLVRSAFGYQVSDLAALSVELVKEELKPVQAVASFSYSFTEGCRASLGYSLQLGSLLFAIGFEQGGAELMLNASYHGSLGPGMGISMLYQFKRPG